MTKILNKEDFKERVFDFENNKEWNFAGERPCVVDFYADWCGPCKMLSPIIDELSKEYKGKVDFYKIDTEKEPDLSAMFGIRSIPTLLFCTVDGKEPQIAQGAYPKTALKEMIEQVMGVADPVV